MYLQNEANCPYCHNNLEKIPKRKTKCKSCGNEYFIRTKTFENTKVIVTEKERQKIDAIEGVFTSGSITREEFIKAKKIPFLKKIFSKNIIEKTDNDIMWGLFNRKADEFSQQNDWQSLQMIYFDMARYLNAEGKESFKMEQQAQKYGLMDYKNSSIVKGVKISSIIDNSTCETCRELDGKVYSIKQALDEMPIPSKDCKENSGHGFCRCLYIPELDD